MEPDLNLFPLASLVPHAGGMLLLDGLVVEAPAEITTRVTIAATTRFLAPPGEVPVWIGLEYMAQTISAHAGLRRRRGGQGAAIGFLLGTRRCVCRVDAFPLGMVLHVRAVLEFEAEPMGSYSCTIRDAVTQAEFMAATIAVYQPAQPPTGARRLMGGTDG